MNTELLLKIADAIEADTEAFNMRSWGSLIDGRVEVDSNHCPINGPGTREMPSEADCKTAFCVAGEALVLSGYEPVYSEYWEDTAVSTADGRVERRWVRVLSHWHSPAGDFDLHVDSTEGEAMELLDVEDQPEVRASGSTHTQLFHDIEVKPQVMIDVLRALANKTFHPRITTWWDGGNVEEMLGDAFDVDAFTTYDPKPDEVERVSFTQAAIIVEED